MIFRGALRSRQGMTQRVRATAFTSTAARGAGPPRWTCPRSLTRLAWLLRRHLPVPIRAVDHKVVFAWLAGHLEAARRDFLTEVRRHLDERARAGADRDADAADWIGIAGERFPRDPPPLACCRELLGFLLAGFAGPLLDRHPILHGLTSYFCAMSVLIWRTAASTFSSTPFLPYATDARVGLPLTPLPSKPPCGASLSQRTSLPRWKDVASTAISVEESRT